LIYGCAVASPSRIVALLVTALATGCGGSGGGGASRSVANSRLGATLSRAEKAPAELALRYFDAVVAKDWEAACATRSKAERAGMARVAGSCAKGFAALFEDKPVNLFKGIEARVVTIRGDTASVEIAQPGQPTLDKVTAVREGGVWRLEDVPESEAP
jgi:hypothetical protein